MRLPAQRIVILLAAAATGTGCGGSQADPQSVPPPDPMAFPSTQPAPPVEPKAVLAYLDRLLRDESRLVVVSNQGDAGELDEAGRRSLRAALPRWWPAVEKEPADVKWKISPDMSISIYGKGSATQAGAVGEPVARIRIYRARQIARVVVTDPAQSRLGESVLVINSADPLTWVTRLFAGEL